MGDSRQGVTFNYRHWDTGDQNHGDEPLKTRKLKGLGVRTLTNTRLERYYWG